MRIAAGILGYRLELGIQDLAFGPTEWQRIIKYLDVDDLELARREAEEIADAYL